MKKHYIIILFLGVLSMTANAQDCPNSINSAQSSSTSIRFKIASGSCNTYPSTISIDGSSFTQASCNGTNLTYNIDTGQTPIDENNFTADFGNGTVCTFVGSVLGHEKNDIIKSKVSVFPNPNSNNEDLFIEFDQTRDVTYSFYNVLGQSIINNVNVNAKSIKISTSNLNPGIYLLKVYFDKKSIVKKIVLK